MRTVYLDDEFKCHVTDDGTMTAVSTDFFDGKCDNFVEGYRLIPGGHCWCRPDGIVFHGEMIAPWKDCRILQACQEQYEATAADSETAAKAAAYDILTEGVTT